MLVRIFVDMIDARRVERRSTALDSVYLIPFFEQKFGKVRTILAGDSRDKRNFCAGTCRFVHVCMKSRIIAYLCISKLGNCCNAKAIRAR
jgi:hypothetical protein